MLAQCVCSGLIENGLQLGQDGDRDFDLSLGLYDGDEAVFDVLSPHAHYVAATLPGVEQQCEGKSRFSSYRVERLKGGNLFVRPSPVSIAFDFDALYGANRIVIAPAL